MTDDDDNATNWRELADQLTPEQIADIEQLPPDANPVVLARAYAHHNVVASVHGDVAPPADAIDEPTPWHAYDDSYARMYTAANWTLGSSGRGVTIFGWQFVDGRIERYVTVSGDSDGLMTSDDARQLAAALMEAAEVMERRAQS